MSQSYEGYRPQHNQGEEKQEKPKQIKDDKEQLSKVAGVTSTMKTCSGCVMGKLATDGRFSSSKSGIGGWYCNECLNRGVECVVRGDA